MCVCVSHSVCSALCNPMDCTPPVFSIHGIFQARILEWVAISCSRRSPPPRNRTPVDCRQTLYHLSPSIHTRKILGHSDPRLRSQRLLCGPRRSRPGSSVERRWWAGTAPSPLACAGPFSSVTAFTWTARDGVTPTSRTGCENEERK